MICNYRKVREILPLEPCEGAKGGWHCVRSHFVRLVFARGTVFKDFLALTFIVIILGLLEFGGI